MSDNKNEPSLSDLGLDQPVQQTKKISISELQRQSDYEREQPAVRSQAPTEKKKSRVWPVFFGVVVVALAGRMITGGNRQQQVADRGGGAGAAVEAGKSPTYGDAIQVLVDDVDSRLGANIFGTVTTSGRSAKVIVESDYFTKLDAKSQRFALETVANEWKTKCYGKSIKFTSWNGQVVAEF